MSDFRVILKRSTRRTNGSERLKEFRGRTNARPEVGKPFRVQLARGNHAPVYATSHVKQVSIDPPGFFTMNAYYTMELSVPWFGLQPEIDINEEHDFCSDCGAEYTGFHACEVARE